MVDEIESGYCVEVGSALVVIAAAIPSIVRALLLSMAD